MNYVSSSEGKKQTKKRGIPRAGCRAGFPGEGDPVNRISSVLYALAALGILILLWRALPPGGFEGDAWGTGIRLRLVGFAALILLMGYFFISRVGKK